MSGIRSNQRGKAQQARVERKGLSKRTRRFLDSATGKRTLWRPSGKQPIRVEKPGRNDPCPCGSGKKWKKCHGRAR
uniref:Putative SEC-C motif contining protein n=1 Tax=viral metagenome TaxID=1070528 RepID=A0A6H1Z7M3_9ZZZZ